MAERLGSGRVALVAGLLARRIPLLVVLLALVFLAVDVLPTDAARATMDSEASAAEIAARRVQLGLDQPLTVRFLHWMRGLATGDLGISARGLPVWDVLGQPFHNTLVLGGLALVLTVLVAVALPAAYVRASCPGNLLDRAVRLHLDPRWCLHPARVRGGQHTLVVVFALLWLHSCCLR